MGSCRVCGEESPARARYCMACGILLVPDAGAEEIRRVTVMFADIVGSTGHIAGIDPEDARAFLDRFVARMRAAIRQYDGCVIGVAGDGIKALFGAPLAHEDHARRACLAALRMLADVGGSAEGGPAGGRQPVRIRVGLSTGTVLLRSVSSDLHVEYSAEGETTHLAAKAQQCAQPGSVLVTAEVARAVRGLIDLRPAPALRIAGLAEAVPTFELVAAMPDQSRFRADLARGLTPFTGRQREIAALAEAAARAEGGATTAVSIVGEAGVGKSRLLWEFCGRLRARGWAAFTATSTCGGANVAFHPLLALLRQIYGLDPADDADAVRRKLAAVDATLDRVPLLVMLDLPHGDPRWPVLDARDRLERTRKALLAALLAVGGPAVLVIEDLHEADAESLGVIQMLAHEPRTARLLLLLESRAGSSPGCDALPHDRRLAVEPLADEVAARLFRCLVGGDESLAGLEARLLARVAGNPFFIEEGVRMLAETGVLDGAAGAYVARGAGTEPSIPGRVVDLIQARVARLARADRGVLQAAAVLGKQLHPWMLRALTGLGFDALLAGLERLVEAGLLRVDGGASNDVRFSFRHAMTQEVTYGVLSRAERQALHARVGAVLESASTIQVADRTELIAHHAVRAEEWARAVEYLGRAAQRAVERSAPAEAVRLLDEALAAVPRLTAADDRPQKEVDLRLALWRPLLTQGGVRRLADEVRRLDDLAAQCGDSTRRARIAVVAAGHHWLTGQLRLAVAAGRQALAIANTLDGPALLVPARQYVGGALHELGALPEAEALLGENIASVAEDAPGAAFGMAGYPAVFCRATRGWLLGHLGRFEEAERDAREALRIGRASGHGFSFMSAAFTAAALALYREETGRAQAILEEGLDLCQAQRQQLWLRIIAPMVALALARQGDARRAAEILDRHLPRPPATTGTGYILLTACRAYAALGRVDDAAWLADNALARARRLGERLWEAEALAALGELLVAQPAADHSAACAAFEASLRLGDELGMRPLAVRCRVGLAAAGFARGDVARADEQLAAARAQSAALGLQALVERSPLLARCAAA